MTGSFDISTCPERPAAVVVSPNGQAGLGAEVPLSTLVALAGRTP